MNESKHTLNPLAAANHRLIEAAPKLLEALRELTEFADSCNDALVEHGEHVPGPCPYVERARAAIAQATGETPCSNSE